jgi:hypothetical protein
LRWRLASDLPGASFDTGAGLFDTTRVTDVERESYRFASRIGDEPGGVALIGPRSDHDVRSSASQLDSHGLADAARAAGDQRDAPPMRSIESR